MFFIDNYHIKLSIYAKQLGISYRTAWEWFKAGKIKGAFKTESGTIIVPEERISKKDDYVVIYSRVSKRQRGSEQDLVSIITSIVSIPKTPVKIHFRF